MSEIEIKTVEEMHRMTMDEIRDYTSQLWDLVGVATKIRDYRSVVGDEFNQFLLEAENIVIGDEEE